MTTMMKICGLSTPEAVIVARDAGASHLGFIFFSKSPRNVTAELAGELSALKGDAKTVAVTVNADDALLSEIVGTMKPDLLQLHGSETLERVNEVKAMFGLPVIKALPIKQSADIDKSKKYDTVADILLLDAKPPVGADLPGGNGISFDWSLVADLKMETPIFLSGGIDLDNADEALGLVKDAGNAIVALDVSSGVESTPGVKDIVKIQAFLAAGRAS